MVKYERDPGETKQRRKTQKSIIDEKEAFKLLFPIPTKQKTQLTKSSTDNNSFNSSGPQKFILLLRTLVE